jgi:serine/threonine-protein kinase
MAPEQIRGQAIGPYTDVYSLGCLIVHVLTGQVPFPVDTEEGKLWAHMSEPPPRPSARVRGLTARFDPVVARAMSKLPGDRHATAGEVGAAMEAALREPVPSRPPRPAPAVPAAPAESASARGRTALAAEARPAKPAAPPRPERREVLAAALADRFNVVVLAALLVVGAALGAIGLMVPLALAVYAAAVVRSYRDPATARRVAATRRRR